MLIVNIHDLKFVFVDGYELDPPGAVLHRGKKY